MKSAVVSLNKGKFKREVTDENKSAYFRDRKTDSQNVE